MFADNQRISHRQLKRQMLVSFGGVLILLVSGEMAEGGRSALLGAFLGYGALLVYFFFLVRNASAFQHLSTNFDGIVKWLIYLIYGSFLVLTGGFLLAKISQISQIYLLPDVNEDVLKILILVTAAIGMGGDTQKRGRMGEVSFPWIFWGFVLLLVFAAVHMRVPDGSRMPAVEGDSLLTYGYRYFAVGCTISLFPLACARTEGRGSQMRELGKSWLILTLLVSATAVILLGTYGYPGVKTMELPVLNLMAGTSFPGGFLDRFDIIWMALLLFALIFSLASLLFYSVRLLIPKKEMTKEKERSLSGKILAGAALLVFAVSMVKFGDTAVIDQVYQRLLECVYAPLFVIMTPLAGWGNRRMRYENQTKNKNCHRSDDSSSDA